jgi:hypothetical protein
VVRGRAAHLRERDASEAAAEPPEEIAPCVGHFFTAEDAENAERKAEESFENNFFSLRSLRPPR